VISATNADFAAAIRHGTFREDLYSRLNGMSLRLPPLRDRQGDVVRMARQFVTQFGAELGIPEPTLSEATEQALEQRDWPGNVRELKNTMRAAVILARGIIEPSHLPPALAIRTDPQFSPPPPILARTAAARAQLRLEGAIACAALDPSTVDLKIVASEAAERAERAVLSALMINNHRCCADLARALHIDPKTLRTKLRKYGLEPEGF
jgi:DNA-binding NtrC family response regulator